MDNKPQVDITHYDFEKYVTWQRWQSYYTQISIILEKKPKTVLVIGPGDHIVVNILKGFNIKVETVDIDAKLNPTYVSDIRIISQMIDKKYDLVLCSQVLEHLEYKYFKKCLEEIKQLALKDVIISLPYRAFRIDITFSLPKFVTKFFSFIVPRNWIEFKFDGEHYWEVGAKGYSKDVIRNDLNEYFNINKEFHVKANSYHLFYECELLNTVKIY